MDRAMQTKSGGTISMVPPPFYQEPKDKTKKLLVAIVGMILATLLVVSFGVFYLMINGQSPAVLNIVPTEDDEPVVIVRDVSFEMSDGVPRQERMVAEGNKLTIENIHDGYTIVLDFDKDLALFKNRTTSSCHVIRLSNFPVEVKMDNLSANMPVFFHEVFTQDDRLPDSEESNTAEFKDFQVIPTSYLELSTTEICADGLSFWTEPMEAQRVRNTRWIRIDWKIDWKINTDIKCNSDCVVAVTAIGTLACIGR